MDPKRLLETGLFSRRDWMKYGAYLGTTFAGIAGSTHAAAKGRDSSSQPKPSILQRSLRRYDMKKSINMWAFPYPDKMSLKECFELAKRAGFDAIEVNYSLAGDLSPDASEESLKKVRTMAEKIGIAISGVCTFLYWPYPFTANQKEARDRAIELATKMIRAARDLGTENLLVVPGAVYVPWLEDSEEVPYKICDERARTAIEKLIPTAEQLGVYLNIENIFFNAYLMSPPDMIEFVDSFQSANVRVHFDTGNIMPLQFPEHWIPLLGKRIKNIHFKEYTKKGTDYSLESFRPLLDGTTNWPAVMEALDEISYREYLTFEYFHPFAHYPEALVYQASDAMDRMLGRG